MQKAQQENLDVQGPGPIAEWSAGLDTHEVRHCLSHFRLGDR